MSPARASFLPVALVVLAVNLLAMPADLYVGDPNAPRKEAIQLLNGGGWGIPVGRRDELGELAAVAGQYLWENGGKGRFFSKYGALNTLLSLPPLLVEKALGGALPAGGTSRRLLFLLNVYNLLLSLFLAHLLHRLFADAAPAPWTPALLVLSCFYGTFLWHYLRAQTLEIFQVTAFTGFLGSYFRHLRGGPPGRLLAAAGWLAALAFLKFSYLLLFPAVLLHAWAASPGRRRETVLFLLAPLLLSTVLLAAVHKARFGGFFESGYGQWVVDGTAHDRFSWAGIPSGLKGFLFSPSRSVFIHFPVLFAAAAGFPAFLRKRPREAWFLVGSAVLFLLALSGFSNWAGQACYGPRYLLFLLPGFCLPAGEGLAALAARRPAVRAAALFFAAALAVSVRLQVYVNDLPFFFFYELAGPFKGYGVESVDRYFDGRPFGLVNRDAEAFLAGKEFPPLDLLARALPVEEGEEAAARAAGRIRALAARNYFWFRPKIS